MGQNSNLRRNGARPHARLLRWSEATCWIAGALLCSLFALAQADSALGSTRALEDFAKSVRPPDQSLWSSARVRDYQAALNAQTDTPVAVLRVPSLNLEVPVFEHDDEISLNRGAGLIAGMGQPDSGGNTGIAGHRDGYFRVLKDIKVGDLIEIRTRIKLHRYRVTSIDIVDESDSGRLHDTEDPAVTLVTCYPFYFLGSAPQRFIVAGIYEWSNET